MTVLDVKDELKTRLKSEDEKSPRTASWRTR